MEKLKITITLESGHRVVLKQPEELDISQQEVVLVFDNGQMFHGVVQYIGCGEIHLTRRGKTERYIGLSFPLDRLIGWCYNK